MDRRLDEIGSDKAKAIKAHAAIANARLAYQAYDEVFTSNRWAALEAAGANKQRPLWASTSTKDKSLLARSGLTGAAPVINHAGGDPRGDRRPRRDLVTPSPASTPRPSR